MFNKNNNSSELVISEDVIIKIASVAAAEINGVAGVVTNSNLKGMLKISKKGVNVAFGDNETVIDVFIKLKAGIKITDIAEQVQQNVKEAVQDMTGRPVTRVNVHVADIELENGGTGK